MSCAYRSISVIQLCRQICSLVAVIGSREVNDQKPHLITFVSISFWLLKAIVSISM